MLMGLELGPFFCRAVSLLRGCWELIVSERGMKTAEENIQILQCLEFSYVWSLKCAQNCLFQYKFEINKHNVLFQYMYRVSFIIVYYNQQIHNSIIKVYNSIYHRSLCVTHCDSVRAKPAQYLRQQIINIFNIATIYIYIHR